jgi:hypothetical protein
LRSFSDSRSYWIIEYQITDGKVQWGSACFRRTPGSEPVLRIPYLENKFQYESDGSAIHTFVLKDPQRALPDTDVYRYQYNTREQVTRSEHLSGRLKRTNASLYYNEDGLLDSIHHENLAWESSIFIRKKKGDKKEINLETSNTVYRWIYNAKGQCISSHWSSKKSPTPQETIGLFFLILVIHTIKTEPYQKWLRK